MGRGGGERTFSLDLERLSSTVLASGSGFLSNDAKMLDFRVNDSLSDDCGRDVDCMMDSPVVAGSIGVGGLTGAVWELKYWTGGGGNCVSEGVGWKKFDEGGS